LFVPFLYALTLFVSAALLFVVQPMIAKMILPLLGGSPAVWSTCMVFFQAVLLAGYAYSHATTKWLGIRVQTAIHLGLLLLPLIVLPIGIASASIRNLPYDTSPALWLLGLLLLTVGLPFFVVSTNAPLLQKWFANTGHRSACDPYFLYAASNLGSLLALLGYPLVLERCFRLVDQSELWKYGYALLMLLTAGCAGVVWLRIRRPYEAANALEPQKPANAAIAIATANDGHERLTYGRRLRWLALAFVPSSLLLGVTTYLSTDIAAVPLLWVIPLAIYLLTFVLAFARRPILPHAWMCRCLPVLVALLTILMLAEATNPTWLVIPLHLLTFFVAAMVCHGVLARDRPTTRHLTEFYLWVSVGGVLGGLFNALLSPIVFNRILEYPLALVLACFLRPAPANGKLNSQRRWQDFVLPAAVGGLAVALILGLQAAGLKPGPLNTVLMFGVPAVLCYTFADRPLRFALGIAAVMLASVFYAGQHGRALHSERNFFGTLRVTQDPEDRFRRLIHGSTLHGQQALGPGGVDSDGRHVPLTYYHPSGPIGQVFEVFNARAGAQPVAVVGLGTGSLAYYAQNNQPWTYYELDPAVERIARNPRYFSFLDECRTQEFRVVIGDARLRLQQESRDREYGLLILDAFSSDAIPVHLITAEALQLYTDKLANDGLLAFHISNRYFNLKLLLANLAQSRNLICYIREDAVSLDEQERTGKTASEWVVMARHATDLGKLADPASGWTPLQGRPGTKIWTDDFSNVLGILK
jgi:hypothetical protein